MFKTIKGTLTVVVSIVIAAAMLLLGIVAVCISGESVVGNSQKRLEAETSYYAEQINKWLGSEMTMVEGVRESLTGMVSMESGSVPGMEQMKAILVSFAEDRDQLLNMYIGTTTKDFVQSNPDAETPEGYDPTERGWYKLAQERGETVVTDPYMDVLIGGMCITVATPVYNGNELYAVIGADYTLDTINDIVSSVTTETGAYGFLVDASGNYVTHPNEAYMPGEDQAVSLAEAMPGISRLVSDAGGSVILAKDYDGRKNYFASAQIKTCSWVMGMAVPQDTIVHSLNTLIMVCVIFVVISILTVILLMGMLIRRQLAPMEEMKQFIQEKIVTGSVEYKAKDEVEEIRYLIDVMKEQFIGTIRKTQEESVHIADQMTQANHEIGEMSGNITTISATMQETGANVQNQTQSIEEISNSCVRVSEAVDELALDSQEMAVKAKETREHVSQIVSRGSRERLCGCSDGNRKPEPEYDAGD